MTEWKTLRVPVDAWEEAKAQKEEHGRTWGEQIVRPDADEPESDADLQDFQDTLEETLAAAKEATNAAQNAEQAAEELKR